MEDTEKYMKKGYGMTGQKKTDRKLRKAAFTVEASLIVPLLLFVMLIAMKAGLVLYTEIVEKPASSNAQIWAVEAFYKDYWIGEVIHAGDSGGI